MGFSVNILRDINVYFVAHVYMDNLFFSSKDEAWWPMASQIVPVSIEAPPPGRAPLSKKR
jgi:hypothetical protein